MHTNASPKALRWIVSLALLAPVAFAAAQTAPSSSGHIVPRSPENGDDPGALLGHDTKGRSGPTPHDAAGHPDLTGYWKPIREQGKPTGNLGRDLPGFELPFTPAGLAAQQYNRTHTVDPEALCILGGIPRHDASGLPFEILQTPKRLAFLYLYTTHRIIPTDGRAHEEDPPPRFFGNPTGSWQGDTLVIDTIAIEDKQIWADENADPQSDAMHTLERWTRPDAGHLHLHLIVDDPKFYTHTFTFDRTWVLGAPGEGLSEYACAQNNVDAAHLGPGPGAIGPDGNRGADLPKTLPANPPSPDFYDKH